MKKLYFLTLLTFCITVAKAQYTLTAANSPVIGDVEKSWYLDTTGINKGSSGTGQIWNYTGISITPSLAVRQNSFVNKSAAPNNSLFPASNMAMTDDNVDYLMVAYTSSNVVLYGFTNNSTTVLYQNPLTYATLPFSYGTIATDTYSGSYTYSIYTIVDSGTVTTTGDGSGTLNTPGNTIPSVFRIKFDNKLVQTVNGSYTETTTTQEFSYYSSMSKFPLLTVGFETLVTSANPTLSTVSKYGQVNDAILQGISERDLKVNFSLYPNPSASKQVELFYVLTSSENYSMNIYNTLGQKVKEMNFGEEGQGVYSKKVDLQSLPAGVYYINLKGKKQDGTQKLIIE